MAKAKAKVEEKVELTLTQKLVAIQSELHAPKNQRNNFGKYNYRSCEDILEAVKPLLKKYDCIVTISDKIRNEEGIVYVDALASIVSGTDGISVSAQAGINPNRKGMDIAQSFGASSSYARKYALNGLFLIDDNKDPDTGITPSPITKTSKPKIDPLLALRPEIDSCKSVDEVTAIWNANASIQGNKAFKDAIAKKGSSLRNK